MNINFNTPYISGKELYYISQAVMNGHTAGDGPFGKKCESLLNKILNLEGKALLTTSCTSALEIAAMLSNLTTSSEFILPSYTFVSSANAFCLRGAKPIFADIDPLTLNMDLDHANSLITSQTKVIVPVHYAGISCDMKMLMDIADTNNLTVIEDAAQAIGSSYNGQALGTFGDFSAFSFHETKNIICGEGGALISNDTRKKETAEVIREKGTNRAQFFRGQVDKYTWQSIGSSYILSDLSAAFLLAQLENFQSIQKRRMDVYTRYKSRLAILETKGLAKLPFIPSYNAHNSHIFYLLLEDLSTRTRLISHLKKCGIMSVFHYIPLHTSPMGESYGYKRGMLPVSEHVSQTLLRLPLCSAYDEEVADKVSNEILYFFGLT
ncbi:dTDP-4-amino-4,6-dideoxygalactose transaminase [Agarivorans sp. 1_MG-2023]|uniref:dTDP-4-amino-4,6-dideoxygalactose transaminase n=1 Tax=Agarivorans sp. 1_MG-2023 TaxID=3062634 RepID=UPI0026E360D8|nr:dTDP-4-amino-4,6-dideoxygalactose transaminase [Agarivorans sp. 1_MG-2023]MDO6764341.1 dTDP-4-amino-4,6-dideoxygalactose transaminase [Agarivorans sp. 1_MG-2023]